MAVVRIQENFMLQRMFEGVPAKDIFAEYSIQPGCAAVLTRHVGCAQNVM